MRLDSVAVLGGGPGGLYAARLLKLSNPDADVRVYEQGVPDKTFGFGVGLASRTQRNLREADPASLDAIVDVAYPHEMSMQVSDQVARLPGGNLLAIARTTLLEVLQHKAEQAGVHLHYGSRRDIATLDADLVIAADGINSATRTALADRFQPHIDTGAGLYLWCGTDFALPTAMFVPVTTEHGTFVAHAYPYAPDRSTFLIETDEHTWRNAGFDRSTEQTLPSDSDLASLTYLQEAFAGPLQGHPLIGNRTRWTQFRTIKCRNWHAGNVVLLGDAAHTAHYSIGSGTKLAMEDAIALDAAITAAPDVATALADYDSARRPAVEHFQTVAHRSELWWESFPDRLHLPVEQLMLSYMTRAGKVDIDHYLRSAPDLARDGLAAYAGVDRAAVPGTDVIEWVLSRPLDGDSARHPTRIAPAELRDDADTSVINVAINDAWGTEADALLRDIPSTGTLWLTGAGDRSSVLTRLAVAERLRNQKVRVVVEAPSTYTGDLAAGLASARTDLVHIDDAAAQSTDPAAELYLQAHA
ncbi:oxidoreductase [Skermania sp. ID1734]|uniref:FAD-dependent monooxygenase n=1 Tax=Skermania sp. ID1734 TaxID=2597516 RepID=UPI0011813CF2|nr:FAD-dependent monooxygenase [Skermania sp. ID1734]TSE01515.1 oxidoreductase [Skermania sp. ID1734]